MNWDAALHLHSQTLALSVTSLAVFFYLYYFILFSDDFLFESPNILQQKPGGEDQNK